MIDEFSQRLHFARRLHYFKTLVVKIKSISHMTGPRRSARRSNKTHVKINKLIVDFNMISLPNFAIGIDDNNQIHLTSFLKETMIAKSLTCYFDHHWLLNVNGEITTLKSRELAHGTKINPFDKFFVEDCNENENYR